MVLGVHHMLQALIFMGNWWETNAPALLIFVLFLTKPVHHVAPLLYQLPGP